MYNLSKDYDTLWQFVEKGHEIFCLVDYNWSLKKVCRDAARIRRLKPFQIQIGVRGMQYGGVEDYDKDLGVDEKDAFVNQCKHLNLEWVCPNNHS